MCAERGLLLFSCGRPQPNFSVVPGPETNDLFPSGFSYLVASRRRTSTGSRMGRLYTTKIVRGKFICGPGQSVRRCLHRKIVLKIVAFKRTIRQFLNTLAVHNEGIRHPPYAYLTHFFCVNVPLKSEILLHN
jgi:hypothetical protein